MAKVECKELAGQTCVFAYGVGELQFDENGIVEITNEQLLADIANGVRGYRILPEPEAPKAAPQAKAKEVKVEKPKAPEPVVEKADEAKS